MNNSPRRPLLTDRVLGRPLVAAGLDAVALLALAYPAVSLRMAQPSPVALTAPDDPALQALAAVQRTFPGTGEPAYVVVQTPATERGALARELTRLQGLAAADRIAHPPFRLTWNRDHTAAALSLPLTGDGAGAPSYQAVQALRHTLIPRTVGHIDGARAYVTGATAQDIDFTGQVRGGLPYAIGFVLVLAFCLLMVAFRSVIVPLTAVLLNLLSVAAAYHVFILSRIREAVTDGEPTRQAIRGSIGRTAGVITAAALVMVCVFALFGTLSSLDLKQAGVGLAIAVMIDATVIRTVLLPAVMAVLGERNWYLPGWLSWMPRGDRADHIAPRQAIRPARQEGSTV